MDRSVRGRLPQTSVLEIEIKTIETNSTGTFQMEFQGHFNVLTGTDFGGTWLISQGTGAYATLRGAGTWSRATDPVTDVRIFTCQGLVHLD